MIDDIEYDPQMHGKWGKLYVLQFGTTSYNLSMLQMKVNIF